MEAEEEEISISASRVQEVFMGSAAQVHGVVLLSLAQGQAFLQS